MSFYEALCVCVVFQIKAIQPETQHHVTKYVSNTVCLLFFPVQQASICTYRTDKSFLQWRPAGVGGHSSDLWQIPRKERRAEGALRKRSTEFLLPYKILGEYDFSATVLKLDYILHTPALHHCDLVHTVSRVQCVQVRFQWLGVISLHREDCSLNVCRMHSAVFGLA